MRKKAERVSGGARGKLAEPSIFNRTSPFTRDSPNEPRTGPDGRRFQTVRVVLSRRSETVLLVCLIVVVIVGVLAWVAITGRSNPRQPAARGAIWIYGGLQKRRGAKKLAKIGCFDRSHGRRRFTQAMLVSQAQLRVARDPARQAKSESPYLLRSNAGYCGHNLVQRA
jgi:hypothetical protein